MSRLPALTFAAVATLASACNSGGTPPAAGPADGIVVVTVDRWWSAADERSPATLLDLPGTVVAQDAVTASPQPRAAIASMLTGVAPDRNGVLDAFSTALPESAGFVPAQLKDAGWATAAFVADPLVGYGSGLERGFALFDAPKGYAYGPFKRLPPLRPAMEPAANFHAWLKALGARQRFFAWIHLSGEVRGMGAGGTTPDPNAPAVRLEGALKEIAAAIRERTGAKVAVIVAGVAGKVDPASETTSGYFVEPGVLAIPFAYRPGTGTAPAPASPVWGADVAAIVAAEAKLATGAIEGALPGVADPARPRVAVLAQGRTDFQWPVELAVVSGGKLAAWEIPGAALPTRAWPSGEPAAGGEAAPPRSLPPSSPGAVDRAKAIVVAAGLKWPASAGPRTVADRATRMKSMPKIHAARLQAWDPAPRRAATAFEEVLAIDPTNIGALTESGEIQALGQLPKRARAVLEKALALDPGNPHAWHWLAHVELLDKNDAKARAMLEASDLLLPNDADVSYDLACVFSRGGDAKRAEEYLRKAWSAGFRSIEHIQTDPDLRHLREDPGFARFMQEVVH